MRKSRTKKDRMNFGETLLDRPIRRKLTVKDRKYYLVPLLKPLEPTPSSLDKLPANLSQFFYTERETDGNYELFKRTPFE